MKGCEVMRGAQFMGGDIMLVVKLVKFGGLRIQTNETTIFAPLVMHTLAHSGNGRSMPHITTG